MNLNSFITEKVINQSQRFVLYKAKRRDDNETVLIKIPASEVLSDDVLAKSLKSEAEAAIMLSHPAIRKGISFIGEKNTSALVCEYIAGKSLAEYLLENKGRAQLAHSLAWARDILHALIYAEEKGYHHANLNPYNILIDEDGKLFIIGFGKNREAWRHSEGNPRYHFPLLYVAPESYSDSLVKPNSDIYSWAVVLYQMLCGHLPWRLDSFSSPEENKDQSLTRGVILPDSDKVPDWLYSVLLVCLKNDPENRIENNSALLELLKMESIDFDWSLADVEESAVEEELPFETKEIQEEIVAELVPEPEISETEAVIEKETQPLEAEGAQREIAFADEDEPESRDKEVPEQESLEDQEESVSEEIDELETHILADLTDEASVESVAFVLSDEEISLPKQSIQEMPEEPQQKTYEPEKQEDETPKETAATQTFVYTTPQLDQTETKAKDIGKMRKIFLVLLAICVVLIAILGIQKLMEKRDRARGEGFEHEPDIEIEIEQTVENRELIMVKVKADTLVMGSINPEANDDEFPLLVVDVPSFMIMPTELTQMQWMMVNKENPSLFKGDDLPVENVSFFDVVVYCNAKSALDGFAPAYDYQGSEIVCNFDADGYRLPTEAEWELAAKGGMGRESKTYSGSEDALEAGWFAENSDGGSHRVRQRAANELRLYDMSGNVAEWVWNWYSPYSRGFIDVFAGPYEGTDRVVRGGSWYHGGNMMRVSARSYAKPYSKKSYIGVRLVRSIR